MTVTARLVMIALACAGCSDTVSLGAWGERIRECGATGQPGAFNVGGTTPDITMTYTNWTWPSTSESMEWTLVVESEFTKDAYLWTHQFGFSDNGAFGLVGLQARGGYQAEPPDGPVEISNMVVFWISSSPLKAELGDIPAPNARTYLQFDRGSLWWTINAQYEWKPCVTYHFRVGVESRETTGDTWYGAWVREGDTGAETFIGRILVSSAFGSLSDSSSMWTNRIGYSKINVCTDPEPASASFGTPRANGGEIEPVSHVNQFEDLQKCPTSRFTDLPDGVRQEVGLRRRDSEP